MQGRLVSRDRVARRDGRPVRSGSSAGRRRCPRRCRSWCGCGLGARRRRGAAGGSRRSAVSRSRLGTRVRTDSACGNPMGEPFETKGPMTAPTTIHSGCRPCDLRGCSIRLIGSIRSMASDPSSRGLHNCSTSRHSHAWVRRPSVCRLRFHRRSHSGDRDARNGSNRCLRWCDSRGSPHFVRRWSGGSGGSGGSGAVTKTDGWALATARAFGRF